MTPHFPTEFDPDTIESHTIGHYDHNARSFFEGTVDHDVSQNYAAFLAPFGNHAPLDILDLGCGPGRDLKYFHALGHRPVGLEGSAEFCQMAREYSGCPVLHQRFTGLSLKDNTFDGVFANASLFHVPARELSNVLGILHRALRKDGILFMSNPRGSREGWIGQRYSHCMEFEQTRDTLITAGFDVLHHYYRPDGIPINQRPWLAVVSRRVNNGV